MSNDVLITPASRKIEFKDSSGNVDAVIQTDSSGNLSITNTGGDLSLGDTSSDVFIGDGTNNIDLVFEQNGEIRGTSGVTVTLGASGATTNLAGTVQLGGTTITSTGAELNILDGVTATTAELNKLDGVTATTAELNKLDGVTATTAELNYTDGVTSNIQTQLNSKLGTSTSFSGDVSGAYNNIQIGSNKVGITELCVTDGSNGQVLTTDGSGTLSFTTVSGGGGGASAIDDLTDGYCCCNSIGFGSNALANESTGGLFNNIAIGTSAGCSITTGLNNVVVGVITGRNLTEGDSNVLIGSCAGFPLITACDNIVLGHRAMGGTMCDARCSTDNIAMGTCALFRSCTGGCSIAMGFKALAQQNTSTFDIAIGHCAMARYGELAQDYTALGRIGSVVIGACAGACFRGFPNVIIGAFAGQCGNNVGTSVVIGQSAAECPTGFSGIIIGHHAARCASTIQDNVAIGQGTLCLATSGQSNVAIGSQTTAKKITTGSRNVILGRSAAADMTTGGCNIVLGYSALSNAVESCLSVVIGYSAGKIICATGGCNTILIGSCSGFDALCCVTTANNIAIFGNNATDCIIQKVATTVPSDCRDKTDIGDMGLGLDFINEICPISYKFDDRGWYKNGAVPDGSKKDAKCRVGFIAQNVVTAEQCYNPNGPLLIANNDREDRYTITETNLIPALVKAIQELSAKVDELENA